MREIRVQIREQEDFVFPEYSDDPNASREITKVFKYRPYVTIGGMTLMPMVRNLPSHADSLRDPGMIVGESYEHRRAQGIFPSYESVPLTSLELAFAEAGDVIGGQINHDDLSEYSQPTYKVVKEHSSYGHSSSFSVFMESLLFFKRWGKKVEVIYRNLELEELNEIDKGDVVTVSKGDINFHMLKIKRRGGRVGFVSKHMGEYFGKKKFVALEDLHADHGFSLTKAQRRTEAESTAFARRKKDLERSHKAKPGSLTSLHDAEESLQAVYDYFDNRVKNGDILLDQWMADGYQYSKEAIDAIKKTRESLHGED